MVETIEEIVYGLAFIITSLLCVLSMYRAMDLENRDIRISLSVLLFCSSMWALSEFFQVILNDELVMQVIYGIGLSFGLITVPSWLYFCSAITDRDYHKIGWLRTLTLILVAIIVIIKLTNPIHNAYFTLEIKEEPFRHLAASPGTPHLITNVLSYSLVTFGFSLLIYRFWDTQYLTDFILVLVLTVIPAFISILHIMPGVDGLFVDMSYESIGVGLFSIFVVFILKNSIKDMKAATFRSVLDTTLDPIILVSSDYEILDYNIVALEEIPEATRESLGNTIDDVFGNRLKNRDGSGITYESDDNQYAVELVDLDIKAPDIESAIVFEKETKVRELEEYVRERQEMEEKMSESLKDIDSVMDEVETEIESRIDDISDDRTDGDLESIVDRVYEINDKITAVRSGIDGESDRDSVEEHDFESLVYSALTTVDTGSIDVSVGRTDTIKIRRSQFLAISREITRKAIESGSDSIVFTYKNGVVNITSGEEKYGEGSDSIETEEMLPITARVASLASWDIKDVQEYDSGFRVRFSPDEE